MERQHWAVTVHRNGDEIVTIESNSLSGRDLTDDDEECIRNCARHLLSFIGEPADLLADATARAQEQVIAGTCRGGAPHYCPNCDNSFTALKPVDDPALPATHAQEIEKLRASEARLQNAVMEEASLKLKAEADLASLRQEIQELTQPSLAELKDKPVVHLLQTRADLIATRKLNSQLRAQLAHVQQEKDFEKNGICIAERVVCIDVPHLQGTVTKCSSDGVVVRWDDGRTGELIWDQSVAYNAYRLQIVRATTRRESQALRELIAKWRKRAERLPKGATYVSGFGHLTTCADELEAALVSTGSADQ